MRTLAIIALTGVWGGRVSVLVGRPDLGAGRFYARLWLENSAFAACSFLLLPTARGVAELLLLLPLLGVGLGGVVTAVMYMWGVRR